jgi:hypothetical protein
MRQALSKPVADEWRLNRHRERSEAIQKATKQEPDYLVANAPRNDDRERNRMSRGGFKPAAFYLAAGLIAR